MVAGRGVDSDYDRSQQVHSCGLGTEIQSATSLEVGAGWPALEVSRRAVPMEESGVGPAAPPPQALYRSTNVT